MSAKVIDLETERAKRAGRWPGLCLDNRGMERLTPEKFGLLSEMLRDRYEWRNDKVKPPKNGLPQ